MPPQAGSFHTEPQPAHASFSRRRLCPQGRNSYALSLLPLGGQSKHPSNLSPKNIFLRAPLRVAPSALLCPRALAHTTRDPSAAGPSPAAHVVSGGPPTNKKMRAHGIAPRTRKSVDFSLKKTHVGTPGLHALASAARTYSLTARTALFPFSFFTKEKKKENRSKFSRFEYIARTHFVRPHDVRDWPVAPRPLKFM